MESAELLETIEYSRPADLPGVEILFARNCARRWRVVHDTYTACAGLDLRGPEFEWRYRRWMYRSGARNVMLMEPGEVHANTSATAPADFTVFFISPALIAAAAAEMNVGTATPHLTTGLATDRVVFSAFLRLHETLQREATQLELQSRLASCVRILLERCTERPKRSARHTGNGAAVWRAREILQENVARDVTLNELATAASLSRYHLVRAFHTVFGVPPHRFQLLLRLTESQRRLASGQPPAAVAADLGFADQSHLTRHFSATFGVTPTEYRRQVSGRHLPVSCEPS